MSLVAASYGLEWFQVSQSQGWADKWATSEVYEIEARAPGDAVPTVAQVRQMMQTLLADRFQLRVSRRNEVMPVYNLVVAPSGAKLKPSASADSAPLIRAEGSVGVHVRQQCVNLSMADLVEMVRRQFDRPLLDKTGLTGGFDFSLDYVWQPPFGTSADVAAAVEASAGPPDLQGGLPIAASLQKELGLRVVPAREQAEILVIDHAERPSAN